MTPCKEPSCALHYYGLGMCHKARCKYDQAVAEFGNAEKSAADQSNANIAFLEVCDCLFLQGRHSEAVAKVRQRMESAAASGDRETQRDMKGRLAAFYRDNGDDEKAADYFKQSAADANKMMKWR